MIDDWIATIPPKPSHTELRRIIATEPVRVTLAYQAAPTPRATVIASHGSDVVVITHYQSDDPDVFAALSCTLERFAAAFRHASQELIEGPPPC